jgi:DivIVA domain-containing protein
MHFSPDEIEIKEFVPTLRGYSREEVRAYLRSLAEDVRRLEEALETSRQAERLANLESTGSPYLDRTLGHPEAIGHPVGASLSPLVQNEVIQSFTEAVTALTQAVQVIRTQTERLDQQSPQTTRHSSAYSAVPTFAWSSRPSHQPLGNPISGTDAALNAATATTTTSAADTETNTATETKTASSPTTSPAVRRALGFGTAGPMTPTSSEFQGTDRRSATRPWSNLAPVESSDRSVAPMPLRASASVSSASDANELRRLFANINNMTFEPVPNVIVDLSEEMPDFEPDVATVVSLRRAASS